MLILYGSLFPFRFDAFGGTGFFELLMGLRFQRTSRGDLVANLLLYMPLGLCLLLSWPARWGRPTRVLWTVLLGTALSFAVEMLQVHAPSRVSSLTDVVLNAGGTLSGGLIALLYLEIGSSIRIPGIAPGRPEPVPLGILLLWLGFRLAPFVPTLDWQKFKDALKPIFFEPQFGALDTYRYFVGWLVAGYAIRRLWRREYAMHALGAIVLIVLAGPHRDRRQGAGGLGAAGAGARHSSCRCAGCDPGSAPRGTARRAPRERDRHAGPQAVRVSARSLTPSAGCRS